MHRAIMLHVLNNVVSTAGSLHFISRDARAVDSRFSGQSFANYMYSYSSRSVFCKVKLLVKMTLKTGLHESKTAVLRGRRRQKYGFLFRRAMAMMMNINSLLLFPFSLH